MEVARLSAVVTADISGFQAGMQKAEQQGQTTAANLERVLDALERHAESTSRAVELALSRIGKRTKTDDPTKGLAQKFQTLQREAEAAGRNVEGAFRNIGTSILQLARGNFSAIIPLIRSIGDAKFAIGGLKEAQSAFKGLTDEGKKLGTSLEGVATQAAASGGALSGLAGPVGLLVGGFVAAAAAVVGLGVILFNIAREGGELAGTFVDLSLNTGIATEKLGLFKIAAEQSGSSIEQFTQGIGLLEKRLQDAASGDPKLSKFFKALGQDAAKAAEDPAKAFEQLAVRIASIEDPILRAKVANETFGRSGAKLISTFITLKEEGAKIQARMSQLGITLSGPTAKGADAVSDEFVVLSAVMDNFKIRVANDLAPLIITSLQRIEVALTKLQPAASATAAFFIAAFGPTLTFFEKLGGAVENVFGKAKKLPGTFDAASAAGKMAEQARAATKGQPIEAGTGLIDLSKVGQPDPNAELRKLLADLERKKPKAAKAPSIPITPVETAQQTERLENERLAVKQAAADAQFGIARSLSDKERGLLDAQLASQKISLTGYYAEKQRLEDESIQRSIDAQKEIIKAERERQQNSLKAEAERIDHVTELENKRFKTAKTPAQRQAINVDRLARVENVQKAEQAERLRSDAKIIEAEGKIKELDNQRAATFVENRAREVQAQKSLTAQFTAIQNELLRSQGKDVEAAGLESGERFANALAEAIANNRPDIVEAIRQLTQAAKQEAESQTIRTKVQLEDVRTATELERVQREVNTGLRSENEGRREQIRLELEHRNRIIELLESEKALAEARLKATGAAKDALAVAELSAEIERRKSLGTQEEQERTRRLRNFQERLGSGIDGIIDSIGQGSDRVRDALRSFITDMIGSIQSELIRAATGGEFDSIGKLIGAKIGELFKGVFQQQTLPGGVAGTPPFNPNAGTGANNPITQGTMKIADKIREVISGNRADAKTISDTVMRGSDKLAGISEQANSKLGQIVTTSADTANCACTPAPQESFLKGIIKAAIGGAVGGLVGGLAAGAGGGGGGGGELSGVSFPGDPGYIEPRATGGRVMAGKPYRWNEPGAEGELFVPAGNGWILNREQAQQAVSQSKESGKTIYITINVPINAPQGTISPQTRQQIGAQAAMALQAALQRNG